MQSKQSLKCLIAAGGTAGHVLPAIAVAEALVARGVSVTFAGAQRIERRLVPEAGFELDEFHVEGFPRRPSLRLIRAFGLAVQAPVACARILRRRKPDVVLGAGGYVAGPMVLAAGLLRIPAALTEADAHLGLANRLAAPVARKVFLAFPIDGVEEPKYQVVGRPIPRRSQPADRDEARKAFGLPEDGRAVLVFGGSLGARRLNQAALDAWADTGPPVLHIAGERDFETLDKPTRTDYVLLPFTDEFGAALSAVDLVVARAGGSVWEVAAAGKPALLVPYPEAAADHQTANARYFERGGGAVVLPEAELDLKRQAEELLGDDERLARMATAMRSLAQPDAAAAVAEELIALATA